MTERKVKLDRANKSILLQALGDVYYGQRANGGSTEVTGRLILRVNDLHKVAWKTLQSDLFSNLPQIKAERMPQDFSVVLPKLWRKRQAWDTERTKRPPYRGEER